MGFRSIVIAGILGVASTATAQTPVDVQVSQDTLRQVQSFENNLRAAIERAGAQLGERARQAVPDILLRLEAPPWVKGVVLPEGEGLLFFVEVPGIEGSSVMLWEMSRRQAQSPNLPRMSNGAGAPASPVAVTPMVGLFTSPEKEYSEYTRQALLDAMLDQAFALPIKENQTLTLSVGVAEVGPSNPLAAIPRRLYLRMKGEDLIALRQNRISRDEARTRILEFRY